MKTILFALATLVIAMNCSFSQSKDERHTQNAKIKFTETTHDYGTIKLNSDGLCEFEFTNEGDAPLVLSNVRSSCGCTVPKWPKDPIKKGGKGIIKVKYNTRIAGSFSKSIVVYSNESQNPVVLHIKGTVARGHTAS